MAEYAILGDADGGTELPKMKIDEKSLTREKQMARFSKTKEFKLLKEHFESRIEFYGHSLPGGVEFANIYATQGRGAAGDAALLSSTIIQELRGVLAAYEDIEKIVKKANG